MAGTRGASEPLQRPGEKAEGKEEACGKGERERERMNTLTVVAFSRSLFAKILAIRGQS